ncbi:hypothetical protein D9M71_577080 [compost metagenome]
MQGNLAALSREDKPYRVCRALERDQALAFEKAHARQRDFAAGVVDEGVDFLKGQVVANTQDRKDKKRLFVQLLTVQQLAQGVQYLVMAAPQQVTEQVLGVAALRWRWCGCQAQLAAGLARGQGILAALERQRRPVAVIEGEDFTDKDHMVAAFVLEGRAALEARRAILQQRCVADAVVQLDLGELVFPLGGEAT